MLRRRAATIAASGTTRQVRPPRSALNVIETPITGSGLGAMSPLDLLAAAIAVVMLLIAAALWIASNLTDRVALRLFSLRYVAASAGWVFAHPQALARGDDVPLASAFVAFGLTSLTIVALDVYLARFNRRRLAGHLVALLLLCGAVALVHQRAPQNPWPVYLGMALGMSYCAGIAWRAARAERNVGHGVIAAACLTYPVVVLTALLTGPHVPSYELGYFVAGPVAAVGLAVLLASMVRFNHRLEAALAQRAAAETALRELNATLEVRVQERTAELQAVVDELESFGRNVSHDLRGPLSGLSGATRLALEALRRGEVTRVEALLAPLAAESTRLVETVGALATLSRLAGQTSQRSLQPLAPLVAQALDQLRLAPETAALMQKVTVEVGALPTLSVDAALVRQAFVNLIANALRFASHGSQAPAVRVGADRNDDGRIELYVRDNGPGIPAERAGELFQPFCRLHGQGLSRSGIGLSIVRRIVEAHDGRIRGSNRPEGGAEFRFSLGAAA
jgi:signal transduction histidine kinase